MNNKLFKNKYRVQSSRLKNWDYSSSGWYFITVCTKNKQHFFGEIIDHEMYYSELGHIAAASWLAMHRVFDVLIPDVWVIMPNHTHFLFGLNPVPPHHGGVPPHGGGVETRRGVSLHRDVSQHRGVSQQKNEFGKTIKNSASSIINHFKGRVTKYADKENIEFEWQAKFYDHIVRDNEDFLRIQNYIIENVQNWKTDKFYDE